MLYFAFDRLTRDEQDGLFFYMNTNKGTPTTVMIPGRSTVAITSNQSNLPPQSLSLKSTAVATIQVATNAIIKEDARLMPNAKQVASMATKTRNPHLI